MHTTLSADGEAWTAMTIRDARDADLPRILDITNEAIVSTTALWAITPVTFENRQAWLKLRRACGFPVLVVEADGMVLAFGSFSGFGPSSSNPSNVEHSIYVDPAARRRGLGRLLLDALIGRARRLGIHAMIGGIDADNEASIELHRRAGFKESARLREVGRKFDRWLDLVFMQKIL